MNRKQGVVAAGHPRTAEAAELILREGGNAFDASLAALAAACGVEPVLASLGGGGFLLAQPASGPARLYDFFVQTPARRRPAAALDFHPVLADFGAVTQEFHIGRGAIAVPGVVRGMFGIHRDLGSVPMREIVAPAVQYAKAGTTVNAFHGYVLSVVEAIFTASPESMAIYGSPLHAGKLVAEGETLALPELADTLETLAIEGEELFYRGEIAAAIARDLRDGGQVTAGDLRRYRLERRAPLAVDFLGTRLLTNPPPSSGGLLIAFALKLMEGAGLAPGAGDGVDHLATLAGTMAATNQARIDAGLGANAPHPTAERLLDPELLARYRAQIPGRARAHRGTTHISIIDADGCIASVSVSNGESSAYIVPGTGIPLNNMLGEEDLNPGGFHRWPTAHRMTSMMAPTVALYPDGRAIATGSGGSNRIRTAILQTLLNLVQLSMEVESAVHAPRIHYEEGLLSIEGGRDPGRIAPLLARYPRHHLWEGLNMFFGGAHTVCREGKHLRGAGDPRRGGVVRIA